MTWQLRWSACASACAAHLNACADAADRCLSDFFRVAGFHRQPFLFPEVDATGQVDRAVTLTSEPGGRPVAAPAALALHHDLPVLGQLAVLLAEFVQHDPGGTGDAALRELV